MLFLESLGNQHLISSFLDLVHLGGDVVHHVVHTLAVNGQRLHEAGEFSEQAESQQVQTEKPDAAHNEASHRARQPQFYECRHHRVQQKRDDHRDHYRDKKYPAVI